MRKQSRYDARDLGFKTKPQMRYLLKMLWEYPEEYSWVKDVLKDHGIPDPEEALRTYWTGPYKKSPDTPSYVYTGGKSASTRAKLIRIAKQLNHLGSSCASKLNKLAIRHIDIDEKHARAVANTFWVINKEDVTKDPEQRYEWFGRLENFRPYQELNEETKQEVYRLLGDKILGRD